MQSSLQDVWHSSCHCIICPNSCFLPNSSRNLCNQIISLLVSIATTYSASIVESATRLWIFETQLTAVPPTVNPYPVVLLLDHMSKVPYASTVGSLMYAMVFTRPDIAHAVGVISKYMNNPEK